MAALGAADRVAGARRAAGLRGAVRAGAERADGCIALLRLGDAVVVFGGLEARARALGPDRVAGACSRIAIERETPPERDCAVGRGAPERAWLVGRGEAVAGARVPARSVTGVREALSGLASGADAPRCVVAADARPEDDEGRREVVARVGG